MSPTIRSILIAILMFLLSDATAFADLTSISCNIPVLQLTTGADGTVPRMVIFCKGGSSAGKIVYFAYKIESNPTIAALISDAVRNYLLLYRRFPGVPLYLRSDLNDVSGDAWGCKSEVCRILAAIAPP